MSFREIRPVNPVTFCLQTILAIKASIYLIIGKIELGKNNKIVFTAFLTLLEKGGKVERLTHKNTFFFRCNLMRIGDFHIEKSMDYVISSDYVVSKDFW